MELRLSLRGGPVARGEVRAFDIGRISLALHELSTRVGRQFAEIRRPGRSLRGVEVLGEVRLTALDLAGGELVFTVGPTDVLPLEIEEVVVRDHFVSTLLRDMLADDRTAEISDHLAEPLGDLVVALRASATEVELVVDGSPAVRCETEDLRRETWHRPRRSVLGESAGVAGVLERIDIHTHTLRVRDDFGDTYDLTNVADDLAARDLVGRRVQAEGDMVVDGDGRLLGLDRARVGSAGRRTPDAVGQDDAHD